MKPQTIARSLAVLLCAGLSIVGSQALADEESDRAERESLMPAIQSDLEEMAEQLSGIAGASSDDGIENAIGAARSLEQNVDKLERVKGDDSAASSIADRYPDYLEDFYEAANALLKLKNAQLAQEQRGLWKICSEEDKNLREAVKPYLDPPDPGGLEKIPQLAESAKSKIHDDFARQLGQESDIASAYEEAKRFSVSDGGWSEVTSRLREGADGTWSKYEAPLKDTKEKCAELDKGKEHPFIVESLGKLTGADRELQAAARGHPEGLGRVEGAAPRAGGEIRGQRGQGPHGDLRRRRGTDPEPRRGRRDGRAGQPEERLRDARQGAG